MKKYLLFAGSTFYPEGGVYDCIGDYDSVEDALQEANRKNEYYEEDNAYDWWQIVDHDTMEIISSFRNEEY